MEIAAIILAAGKGTRMNDNSKNKVAFTCAGVPVIRRVVDNMLKAGVKHFVLVVGHNEDSVKECLTGIDNVIYAKQEVQNGTGDATLCGMKALKQSGFVGKAIVSMGDKIVSSNVVKKMIDSAFDADVVWGVQPLSANKSGGRIVMRDGKPYGVVELADVAYMALAGVEKEQRLNKLLSLGLNEKKATKVIALAENIEPNNTKYLCGQAFSAEQILNSEFANAGFYCFDLDLGIEAIQGCNSNNAQNEIYLTDTLEFFAKRDSVNLVVIESKKDMLTFSTRKELREISRNFMRHASEFISEIESGKLDGTFFDIYGKDFNTQKGRYIELLKKYIVKYGDGRVVITRAPGRINLMGRHIDHRGGSTNVLTVDKDTILVCSPREDDLVVISNLKSKYPDCEFSMGTYLSLSNGESWVGYISSPTIIEDVEDNRGSWENYFKAAVLRFAFKINSTDFSLCGMNVMVSGNIPAAAGLSSSSSLVVAVAEAIVAINSLNITDNDFVELCGEGEWFVGSRGGAGDHAAMKFSRKNMITKLGFLPFVLGESVDFSEDYSVLVANSMQKAKKSEGSKDKFNAKIASYEIALMLINKLYPEKKYKLFRDFALEDKDFIYQTLLDIPETMDRACVYSQLSELKGKLDKLFATHVEPDKYDIRGLALFGVSECIRAERFLSVIKTGDYKALGEMMKISHDGDRIKDFNISDEYIKSLMKNDTPLELVSGDYGCSTVQIDELCDLLNSCDGVVGSELVGAGLGGCVVAIIKKDQAEKIVDTINKKYYDKYEYKRGAGVYTPASGSCVLY